MLPEVLLLTIIPERLLTKELLIIIESLEFKVVKLERLFKIVPSVKLSFAPDVKTISEASRELFLMMMFPIEAITLKGF